ncbi:S41 family peptidase [Qipengyuania aquimaris]|uniref:S41 family peptidase n=1 Tax=Qipengyuania aquimaris TaxID=255984 RepID=UPI001CD561EE|nr:PDZ domain-containing protein [Qipengyuania aquimaris]MCA0904340.1 hypothetical protein [Qipengyuania aquimaris]
MRVQAALGAIALVGAASGAAVQAQQSGQPVAQAAFDAAAAWGEFETLLRGKYAYIERDDIDVDAQLARSKEVALKSENPAQFRKVIHQTALTFMDPHLIVGPFTDDDYAIVMTAADLDLAFIDGEAKIVDVRRDSPAFEAGLRPGDTIASIDGTPASGAARLPFGEVLSEPTDAQLDYGLTLAGNGKRAGLRKLVVRKVDASVHAIELASTRDWANSLRDRPTVDLRFIGQDDSVAVITPLNSLGNNDTIAAFDAAMEEAKGASAVVLDMRETPSGGNTEVARSIIGHFVSEAQPYQMHRVPVYEREFTVPRQFVEYVMPREPYYGGPVFVLHGRWTGSMGEGIVIGMDAASDAVTIGSDMGDLLGGLWNYDLEHSDARVDLGGEALFHVNGTPREDYIAQVEIMPASTARDGSDPAITRVFELLEKSD